MSSREFIVAGRLPGTFMVNDGSSHWECDDVQGVDAMTAPQAHALTHARFSDGRLTPACVCGWWSADGSHLAFERHIRRVSGDDPTYKEWTP